MEKFLSWFIQTQTVRGIVFIVIFIAVFVLNFFHLMPDDQNLRFLLTIVLLLTAGLIIYLSLNAYYKQMNKENQEILKNKTEEIQNTNIKVPNS
jgi:zinc transporter ZupT